MLLYRVRNFYIGTVPPSVPQDIHKISNRYPGLDVVDINSGYPLDIH